LQIRLVARAGCVGECTGRPGWPRRRWRVAGCSWWSSGFPDGSGESGDDRGWRRPRRAVAVSSRWFDDHATATRRTRSTLVGGAVTRMLIDSECTPLCRNSLRNRPTRSPTPTPRRSTEYREQVQEREVRLTAQRILATHLKPGQTPITRSTFSGPTPTCTSPAPPSSTSTCEGVT
jgi:hypothetical protein